MAVVEAVIEDTSEIAEAMFVASKDRDGFGAACPVGELSVGPATKGEYSSPGDVDLSTGGAFPSMLEGFLGVIRVSIVVEFRVRDVEHRGWALIRSTWTYGTYSLRTSLTTST